MTSEKMLYVKSNDYWGYDAADFDSNLNFYTYTWTVPQSMYNAMDDSDQGRLFPCALFYVQGVTDNHNFLTLTIDVTGSDAKVRGMQGAKRRTLKFETGVPYAYSVGSLNMKEAPAGSTSIASIEEAVKDGSATMTGVFNVDAFLTDASAIAEVVGLSTTSSAESFEAEVSDFYPQSSAEIGDEQSGRGVPVAYGSGSSQYVEPPVVELEAEVSDFYPQSSAEIGDEQSGRGVPVAYGSGSSQYVEPPVVELSAEVSDFYPQSSAEIGDEQSGRGVPVAYGSGSSQYVEPPVVELSAEVIDDDYMDAYSAMGEPDAEYDQGYNDQLDESLGMRDGAERNFRQSMKDRRDESKGTEKYDGSRPYAGVDTMDAETASFGAMPSFTEDPAYLNHKTNDFERTDVTGAVMYRGKLMPCMWCGDKSRMIFGSRSDPMFVCESRECHNSIGIKNNTFDGMSPLQLNSAESFGADMIYEGLPVIPDSYGTNSALSSGQGVPVWYGSAEHSQGYNDKMDESLGMRHRGRHSQSMKDRRDEASAMDKDHSMMGRKYDDVMTMDAESRFDKLADKIAKQYEKKGMNPQEAREVGKKTAYKIGAAKYGKSGMAAKSRAGRKAMAADGLEDYNYQSNDGSLDSAGFTEGTVNPTEFTRLGAYDVPVIPNSFGEDSSEMGYGVPQWYGADTFGADSMVDNFKESAPPMNMGKKTVGLMAIIGLLAGAYMGRK